jgi:hypothetical protein
LGIVPGADGVGLIEGSFLILQSIPLIMAKFQASRILFRSALLVLLAALSWGILRIERNHASPESGIVQRVDAQELESERIPLPFSGVRKAARWCTPSSEGGSVYFVTEARILEEVFLETARGAQDRLLIPVSETETVTMKVRRVFPRSEADFTMMGRVESSENSMAALTFKDGTLRGEIILYGSETSDHRYFIFSPGPEGKVEVTEMSHEAYFSQDCCPTCNEKHGTVRHVSLH